MWLGWRLSLVDALAVYGSEPQPNPLADAEWLQFQAQRDQHHRRGDGECHDDGHAAERHGPGGRPRAAGSLVAHLAHPHRQLHAAREHRHSPQAGHRRRSAQRGRDHPDAEDLTQQVALKAFPRLRQGAPASAIRGYLFATARSVLGAFWSTRLGLSTAELHEDLALAVPQGPPSEESAERAQRILAELSDNYRRVLDLPFLHGYSLKAVAAQMRSTVGPIKGMQLPA